MSHDAGRGSQEQIGVMDKDIEYAVLVQLNQAQDNLARAVSATKNMHPDTSWGESGLTVREMVETYQAEVDRWRNAYKRIPRETAL